MKPLFQIHFQSTLAQYSFPVSSLAISFTLPTMRVAYQVNSSERVVSVPHQRTDSAYPEVTSHEFTERRTPKPTYLIARKTKRSFLRPPQMAKNIMKFKHSHHLNTGLQVNASKACLWLLTKQYRTATGFWINIKCTPAMKETTPLRAQGCLDTL